MPFILSHDYLLVQMPRRGIISLSYLCQSIFHFQFRVKAEESQWTQLTSSQNLYLAESFTTSTKRN